MLQVSGSIARIAASLIGVNKTTASYYFHRLQLLVYENSQDPGIFEGDESYVGPAHKGKRGRGAGSKVLLLGLLKRNGKVYACIISNAKADTLIPIIRE